jgi:hypothetical protein
MDVVSYGVRRKEVGTATPDDAAYIAMHIIAPRIVEHGCAFLCAKHEMDEDVGKRLGHMR